MSAQEHEGVLVVSCLRRSFPASYRGPVRLAKCTDPPTVMVLAFAPMETVSKWPRSVSIPLRTVASVAE